MIYQSKNIVIFLTILSYFYTSKSFSDLNFTVKELSLMNVDEVAGFCSLWDKNTTEMQKQNLDISYFRALLLLTNFSLKIYNNAQDYEQFWKKVHQKVYNNMSYYNRFFYYMLPSLNNGYGLNNFFEKDYFEEISNTKYQEDELVLFIAQLKNKDQGVIGSICAIKDGELLEIKSMLVQSEYRRKGVASALLKQIEIYAKEHGLQNILYEVFSSNKAMIQCALRLNYIVVDTRDDFFDINGQPIEILYFEKNI